MKINALTTNFTSNVRRNSNCSKRNPYCQHKRQNDGMPLKADAFQRRRPISDEEIAYRNKIKQEAAAKKEKTEARKNKAIGAGSASAVLLAAYLISSIINGSQPSYETINGHGNSVEEIADYLNMPTKIVEMVNKADSDDILDKYIIPEEYNGFDVALDKLNKKLVDQDDPKKIAVIEEKIEEITLRKKALDKMGTVYIDPKTETAHIFLNGTQKAEDVKTVLGITKSGQFRDDVDESYGNGTRGYTWYVNDATNESQKDYSNSTITGHADFDADLMLYDHQYADED